LERRRRLGLVLGLGVAFRKGVLEGGGVRDWYRAGRLEKWVLEMAGEEELEACIN
jgi:hypothetical protein